MQFKELPEEKQELLAALFDPESPLSLASTLPWNISAKLLKLLDECEPALLEHLTDEEGLIKYLRSNKRYEPTVNDHRVRYLFWHEHENALAENRQMNMKNVHSLVCNEKTFQVMFLKHYFRAAFLMCKPMAYQQTLKEMLVHGMGKLRNILDIPATDPVTGKFNPKIVELQLKITAMVDMRLHGAPTQKIHQVNQNLPGALTKGQGADVRELIQKGDMKSIQNRLFEIEAERKKLEGRVTTAPVEVVEAELVHAKPKK